MKTVEATLEGIAEAAASIQAGRVVAYPTETVYGLGVDPFSRAALEHLFAVKGRDPDNPVLVIVASPEDVYTVAGEVSPRAWAYIRAYWPGPLSLLLPKGPNLPKEVTAGRAKVCVRCSAGRIARELCRAVGGPITSTSANPSGLPPARSLSEIQLEGVALGVDGGTLPPSLPSTVFDPDLNEVLREGVVPTAELKAVTPI